MSFDELLKKRLKENGLELSTKTIKVLRENLEEKVVTILDGNKRLHNEYFNLFPQYNKQKAIKSSIFRKVKEINPEL